MVVLLQASACKQWSEVAKEVVGPGNHKADVVHAPNYWFQHFHSCFCVLFISWISCNRAMCLCSGRVTVSVLKLKCHLRMIFVSDSPPSTVNLSSATIFTQRIGSFTLFGWAGTSIGKGITASSQLAFMGRVGRLLVPSYCWYKHLRSLGDPLGCPRWGRSQLQKVCRRPNIFLMGWLFEPMHVSLANSLFAEESTMCTSPETILIQIEYFFHVFHVSLILLSTDLMYSRVPGDQEGPLFFRLKKIFLVVVLRTNWYTTICILDTNLYLNVSTFTRI